MNIYVGNLSTAVTEEDLNNLFSEYGNITNVKIIKDNYTGVSKGFGFVELTGKTEDAIQQLNSKDLKGQSIVVNEALSTYRGDLPPRMRHRILIDNLSSLQCCLIPFCFNDPNPGEQESIKRWRLRS